MEFWGIEVKPGQTVKCEPEDDRFLHLSQAALGESKKGTDNAVMYVKVDDQKLVIGSLSADKFPQIQFDLVFDKKFELSHTSKSASVFFSGYKVSQPAEEDEMDFDSDDAEDEEEEEHIIPAPKANGEQKKLGKTDSSASKAKAENNKVDEDDDDDDSDDDDSEDGLSPEDDDDDDSSEDDSSDEDEDESDEEETPKKPETGKKRAAEVGLKTPASDKKAKVATPSGQKTGDKKGVHVATPHPAKQASKTPVNNDKAKEKSPKSGGGSISCKSCSKTFNSEMALQSHSKAKHSAK